MSKLTKDMVLLILQFFEEEGFKDAARMLERESGFYFKMDYFEEMMLSGKWEEAEKYVSGFTKLGDNKYSTKIYFEMRKQNFLEVLDKGDRARALDILIKDLKVFEQHNKEVIRGMHELLTLKDIRDHNELSTYRDTKSVRESLMHELRKLINTNPLFHGKLELPSIQNKRLTCLINQSLNWQHMLCQNPQANPVISTLFTDHACPPSGDHSSSNDNNQLPSQTTSMSVPTSSSSSESTPPTESMHSSEAFSWLLVNATTDDVEVTITVPQNEASVSDGQTSTITDHGPSSFNVPGDLPAVMHPDQEFSSIPNLLLKDPPRDSVLESCESISNASLPMAVGGILKEDSSPTCMDFHPIIPTTLLVGTVVGDIGLWDASSRKKLLSRNFKVWDIEKCSMKFKAALLKDPHVSINSIVWSPDGCLFGVAYSKHMVQIYNYHAGDEVRQKLEIDAHVGSVNDLAFSFPEKQLLVLTCGNDKTVKAWDATTGVKLYTFEGHDEPVYSLCPHSKASIHFIFSVSVDGNIKAWLYDNLRARVDLYAPGLGCTSLAYTAGDRIRRLFSCGTSKCGESFLVEWDENEGSVIRTYQGLQKTSSGVVHFDILKDQFLAAGDEHQIKIWDMDRVELLTTINAGDELPANPRIQFNKDGTLLAAFAKENSIKILSTDFQLLPTTDACSFASTGALSDTFTENRDKETLEGMKSKFTRDTNVPKDCKLFEINGPSQCQTLWLPSHENVHKISRLSYNHAGNAILALSSNSTHLFWKWSCDDLNLSGKATTKTSPQLWQPRNCMGLMKNDLSHAISAEAVPCFALSKNDCYLVSASGGKISLYNLLTFKTMVAFMPPSPATTCLAFYPLDNNIIAVGRDDSMIIIYNVRLAEVICKLRGHSKRVCALAFSSALNVLVSSGADAEIFVWDAEGWEKRETCVLPIPGGKKSAAPSDSYIQFHQDQKHILAVHETLLAVYKTNNLECVKQWTPKDSLLITGATFSCDSQMIYASFADGTICTFDASNLVLCCRIFTTAYVPPSSSCDVYPVAIVAHPQKPSQFAVGLTDGRVAVLEPLNPAGKWILFPTDEDESVDKLPSVDCFEDLSWLKEWSTKN